MTKRTHVPQRPCYSSSNVIFVDLNANSVVILVQLAPSGVFQPQENGLDSGTSDAILLHLSFQNVSFDGKAGCWTIAIDQEERWNLLINFYVWPLALIYICASCISLFVPIAFYICANLSQSFLHFFKPQSVPTFQKCHNIADTCGKGNFQLLEP